jgi:hypothetical protein
METKNTITAEIKRIAFEKAMRMPLGHYSRLKINDEISDIVIQTSSSGVWFHDVPGTISDKISTQIICFINYKDLK